jgi:hypothetical protein
LDDGEVVLDPTRITWVRDGVGGDMFKEVASTEVDVEEMAPMVVVVGWEI